MVFLTTATFLGNPWATNPLLGKGGAEESTGLLTESSLRKKKQAE
jgi:hypothetical protein